MDRCFLTELLVCMGTVHHYPWVKFRIPYYVLLYSSQIVYNIKLFSSNTFYTLNYIKNFLRMSYF